jgi:hypothetical protein
LPTKDWETQEFVFPPVSVGATETGQCSKPEQVSSPAEEMADDNLVQSSCSGDVNLHGAGDGPHTLGTNSLLLALKFQESSVSLRPWKES